MGYCLIESLVFVILEAFKHLAGLCLSTLPFGEMAFKNPALDSNTALAASMPFLAKCTASMALDTALPACMGLDMDPKLAVSPPAMLAARDMACVA